MAIFATVTDGKLLSRCSYNLLQEGVNMTAWWFVCDVVAYLWTWFNWRHLRNQLRSFQPTRDGCVTTAEWCCWRICRRSYIVLLRVRLKNMDLIYKTS